MSNTSPKRGKIILWIIILAGLALPAYVIYALLFKKSDEVNSGLVKPVAAFREHKEQLWAVRFGLQDSIIASGSVDSTARIWKRDSGNVLHILKHPVGVTSLDFSPNGTQIVTTSYDGTVRVWDWMNNKTLLELKGHEGTIWSVVFSPDGKSIASSGEDKIIRLWDAASGNLIKTFTGHTRNIWKVRFSPDGKYLFSSGFDADIKVWDIATGSLLRTMSDHSEAVVGLAISPDGKLVASGSDDKTIKLWDFNTGKLIRTMKTDDAHMYAVAFSPDGKRIISGSRDKDNLGEAFQNFLGDSDGNKGVSMRLWDVETGKLLQTMSEHYNDVMDVSFSQDGKWIVSASTDKIARLWQVVK